MQNVQLLLQAVQVNPADDLAYLALADCLDEQGESAWAELIRLQNDQPQDKELSTEGRDWLAPFVEKAWKVRCTFRRGLVERLELTSKITPGQPLEELRLLLTRPIVGAVQTLKIQAHPGAALADLLASAPALGGLRCLELVYPNMGDEGLAALADSDHLRHLHQISIVDCYPDWYNRPISTQGLHALAASRTLPALTELELTYSRVDAAGGRILAQAERFQSLQRLILIGNRLGDGGAQALASSTHQGQLRTLDLSCNGIGDEGIEALAASGLLANVRELHLGSHHLIGHNLFGDRGARALAESPWLNHVTELTIEEMEGRIGRAGLDALRQRFGERLVE